MQVEEARGYSDDRKAARDALLALLGAGVLVAAAPAKRRKTLGLLAILAVLALFLLRRALAATEPTEVAAPEREPETAPSDAAPLETEEPQAEEVALEEPVAVEVAVEETAVEETAVEETVAVEVEEPAVEAEEEAAAEVEEEVAADVEAAPAEAEAEPAEAPAEQPSEFEALDAALAALIGELERVEASRLEEVRIEEAQRAWREAQAEDALEQQEAEERAREEAEALVLHAGRQLVHAGGSDADGYGAGDHDSDESFHLPDERSEAAVEPEGDAEEEAAETAYADAWRDDEPAPTEELYAGRDDASALHPVVEEPVQEAAAAAEESVREEAVEPEPVAAAPLPGGLIGLIGRYSHRDPVGAVRPTPPAETHSESAQHPVAQGATTERDEEPAEKPAAHSTDWL